jgi:hypothetical protein
MLAIQLSRARQRSIRPDDGVMGASSGNRRIALALVALVGSVVALHVHAVRVHGIQPTRTTGGLARSTQSGSTLQPGEGPKSGTQTKRISRLTLGR